MMKIRKIYKNTIFVFQMLLITAIILLNGLIEVRAVDKLDDFTPPTLTFDFKHNSWTNENVSIIAIGADDDSGVKQIKLPNGNVIMGNSATFVVSENGVYYFEVTDFMGNTNINYAIVDKIDRSTPTINIENNQKWNNSSGVPVKIFGEDK